MLRDKLTSEGAQTIALQALAYLAAEPEEIGRFLQISGLDVDDLRAKAGEPDLLRAVLDYILADDTRVTGLCQELGVKPTDLHAANHVLEQL